MQGQPSWRRWALLQVFVLITILASAPLPAEEYFAALTEVSHTTSGQYCNCFQAWAANEWRLWERDSCKRPKTIFNWCGAEREYVDGSEREPLESDRPDFTEASTVVGLHRIQLEMGYTYTHDRDGLTSLSAHSYPEALLRIGMFAEWFEARIAWNYGVQNANVSPVTSLFQGGEDLYLGAKFALTTQDKWMPEMVILPQMTVPTGGAFSSGEVMPGVNWLYGWDINDFFSLGASTQVNRTIDDADIFYAEFAQSVTIGYNLIEDKLGAYTETFAFFPCGALVALPQYYFDGGFTYKANPNLQFDIRLGVGLNAAADNLFVGSGAVLRF